MMLNTPPSKDNVASKYLMMQSTNNGAHAILTCTPKDDQRKVVKEEVKHTTMF